MFLSGYFGMECLEIHKKEHGYLDLHFMETILSGWINLRMCCSFYLYLPIILFVLTGYSSIVTTFVGPVVGVICLLHASVNNGGK